MANSFTLGKNSKFGTIDFSKLKSGITKKDLGIEEGSVLSNIFDSINTNKDGDSAEKLDRNELNAFIEKIRILCGKDTNLSESEAKKYELSEEDTLGGKNKKELLNFLSKLSELTQGVKELKQSEKSEIITYEDGHTEELFPDGKVITTVIDKAKGTKTVTTKNADGTEKVEETETTEDGEIFTISENGKPITKTTKKTTNGKTQTEVINYKDGKPSSKTIDYTNPNIHEEYIFENEQPVLKKRINSETGETIIYDGNKETIEKEQDGVKTTTNKENGTVVSQSTSHENDNNQTEVTTRVYDGDNYTETVTVDGKARSQTKLVNGKDYTVNYDEDGNTVGIIVQNGETIQSIANKFGVDVKELIKANASKVKGKYPKAYFPVGVEIKIPRKMNADEQVLQGRKSAAEARAEYQRDAEIRRQKAEEARMKKQTVIAKGNNGYYITKDGYGTLRYFNSNKKEISAEEFKKACPTIYKNVTEKEDAAQRGATQRTRNKYDTATIKKEAGDLAKKIHDQISGASRNENTINMLRAITPENAAFVISEYQRMYGVSLAKDIDDEWGLDINTVKEHVCKKLVDQAKSLGINGIYYGDYQKINDLSSLQTWINNASSKIINHMSNAKETYYATEAEEAQRETSAQNKKTAKASAEQIVDDLIKATSGWNDVDGIKRVIARIDSPEELKEVNRLLALKGYPPTDKYSAIENFIYQESNHDAVHTYNSSDYLEQTVQNWINNGTLKGQDANEAQARMAARVLYDGGDGFGTDCEKIKKAVRMIKCPKPTGDRAKDNAQAREVYRLVNNMIKKHNTFYGLGSPCTDLLDYCEGEMWDSEVKYLKGILAETNAIQGQEKAQAVADLTQEAVEYAGTDIEYLEQAIRAIDSPEDRKAVEAKLAEYCKKKGIKPQIEGQSYLQAILYDECDTFMGISTDHKEIRKFNEMLIEQGAYTEEEIINLRAEQAALQILEGNFDNIKDAVEQIKDPKVLAKVKTLLATKGYNSLDEFLSKKLNQTKSDLINAELASNNVLLDANGNIDVNKIADVAYRLIQNSDFDIRAMGVKAIRNEQVAKAVDAKFKQNGKSLAQFMEQFNKEKAEYKSKAEFWDGWGKVLATPFGLGGLAEDISDAYKENTDSSDNMFVEMQSTQTLTPQQKASYDMTVKLMEQKLAQMKKDYQAALDSQGAVSWAVNRFCEQYGIGTTREEIQARIEHDTETVRLLKLAAEGKLGKMVDGKTVAVTFEEVFKERNIGTNFDSTKVAKVQNQAEMLVAMNYAKTNIAVCWEELENGLSSSDSKRLTVAIVDTLEKLSNMTGRELSLAGYGYSVKDGIIIDSNGKAVPIEKLRELANQLKQGLSDIAKDLLGEEIPLNTSSSKINELLEDSYNKKKEGFKQEFKDAFGQDCPDEIVEDYISTIETGKMVVSFGVMIAAVVAAPFTGGGSLAVFAAGAGVSLGLNALEHSTDANGWTNAEWTSDAEQAMWDGLLAALGMKVGMIADAKAIGVYKVAAQNMLKKVVPNIADKTLERASICIARVRALGYEVSSDTIQSLAQMYCQEGEFNEETFVRDLLMSVAGNAAGHVAGTVGDVRGGKGANPDAPRLDAPPKSDAPQLEAPKTETPKLEEPKADGTHADPKAHDVEAVDITPHEDLEAVDVTPRQHEEAVDITPHEDLEAVDITPRPYQEAVDATPRGDGKADAGSAEPKMSSEDPVKAASLRKKLGNQLFAIYQSVENGIATLKDITGYNKLKSVITNKFKNSPTEMSELLTRLNKRAKEIGLNIIETTADRTARMGKTLAKYYDKIISAIDSLTDMSRFNKLLDSITTKFKDFKDDMRVLIDRLYERAKSIGLSIKESITEVYAKAGIKAEGVNPLDKYTRSRKGIDMSKSHDAWVASRKDLFGTNMHDYGCWSGYTPTDQHHGAWKMHLFSVSEADWREMCDVIIPYLKEHDIEWETFNAYHGADYLNGSKQQGKAFTIYPKNNEDMAQIAKDLDYIIRKNKLETSGSHITGDNQMGSTGRLFYRYEFNSGAYKDEILDLGNKSDYAKYHNRYDANRGEGKYLADDMTEADDIWRNFDPSDPSARPASSSNSGSNTQRLQKGQPFEVQGEAKLKLANTVEIDLNDPQIKSRIDNLPEGGRLTIGREGDIKINDNSGYVSREHVIIEKRNGKIYVIDNSTNGTTITQKPKASSSSSSSRSQASNATPLQKGQRYELQDYPKIRLADTIEIDLNDTVTRSRINNLKEGQRLTIGREGDIQINDPSNKISRIHVIIEKRNGKIYIIDNSTNGTSVIKNADSANGTRAKQTSSAKNDSADYTGKSDKEYDYTNKNLNETNIHTRDGQVHPEDIGVGQWRGGFVSRTPNIEVVDLRGGSGALFKATVAYNPKTNASIIKIDGVREAGYPRPSDLEIRVNGKLSEADAKELIKYLEDRIPNLRTMSVDVETLQKHTADFLNNKIGNSNGASGAHRGSRVEDNVDPVKERAYRRFDKTAAPEKMPDNGILDQKSQYVVNPNNMPALRLIDGTIVDLNSPEIRNAIMNLQEGEYLTLGRNGDFEVSDSSNISRHHILITKENGQIQLKDVSSFGHTKALSQSERELRTNAIRKFNKNSATVELTNNAPINPNLNYILDFNNLPKLRLYDGTIIDLNNPKYYNAIQHLREGGFITLGRNGSADIGISNSNTISRHHILLTIQDGELIMKDISANGGTYRVGDKYSSSRADGNEESNRSGRSGRAHNSAGAVNTDEVKIKEYKNVLGIQEDVPLTKDIVKKAYRKKSLEWHPDRHPDNIDEATRMMQKINEAKDALDKFLDQQA